MVAVLYLGLGVAERQGTGLKEDIEDLQREVRDLKQMVDVLGPAALGTQRILTHWAAQTGGLRVSEDELLAEGRLVADEEWQGQLAERGLFSPGALAGKLEGEVDRVLVPSFRAHDLAQRGLQELARGPRATTPPVVLPP